MPEEAIGSPHNGGWLDRLLRNPVVNAIGWIATVLGLFLTVYFYIQSTKKRDLVYYVNPAQAVVVKTGETSNLHVFYGDRELRSDVTAAQIALWNQGNDSIRPENILEGVVIRTNPSVPILESIIRKKSRSPIYLSLDQSRLSDGILGLKWNILEQGDGAVIQLVYAGPPTTQIQVSGVVEGQHQIRGLKDRVNSTRTREIPPRVLGWSSIIFGLAALWYFLFGPSRRFAKKYGRSPLIRRIYLIGVIPSIVVVILGSVMLFFFGPPSPPFGF